MTISSSLNAGVAGLTANASRLASISDNIANSSTKGYKRAETNFHSMVLDSGSRSYNAGGVTVTTSRIIDQSGALVTTTNSTDIAVRGRGFIPVTSETSLGSTTGDMPMELVTTGSFRPDENGILRTAGGKVLMGWPAAADGTIPEYPRDTSDALQPVQVKVNEFAGRPTTNISLGINLPATDTKFDLTGGVPRNVPIEYIDNLGTSQKLEFTYTPQVAATATDPATNTWTMSISDLGNGGASVGEYTLVFDDSRTAGGTLMSVTPVTGGPYDPASGIIDLNVSSGSISLKIGALGSNGGMTQLSDKFSPAAISKNGSPVSNLTSIEIDASGNVLANFDNGITRTAYQIPVIDFPNINGLEVLDDQTFRQSNESGTFYMWDAGDGPTGDIVSYALEESTTDVAGELTDLIKTQRAYSSNAKVIQTVDEMLQETTNIKR